MPPTKLSHTYTPALTHAHAHRHVLVISLWTRAPSWWLGNHLTMGCVQRLPPTSFLIVPYNNWSVAVGLTLASGFAGTEAFVLLRTG